MNLVTFRINDTLTISPVREYLVHGVHGDGSAFELSLFTNWLFYTSYIEGRFGKQHPLLQCCRQEILKQLNHRLADAQEAQKFDIIGGVCGLIVVEVWPPAPPVKKYSLNNMQDSALDVHRHGLRQICDIVGQQRLERGRFLTFLQKYVLVLVLKCIVLIVR